MGKEEAYLFGPFVGELSWEFFRFAPYAIYLKKRDPECKLIVLTRHSRFDLYGKYADILIPLKIKDDKNYKRHSFKLLEYKDENYYVFVKYFEEKFRKRYSIIKHIYPDIRMWRYKVKWQLPRDKMDYDFIPRRRNIEVATRAIEKNKGIVDNLALNQFVKYKDLINSADLISRLGNFVDDINSTTLGGVIECIKLANFVVGNIRHDISHLAVLLGTPLLHIENSIKEDSIKLLNPNNTPVILCDNIEQALRIYENEL